MIHALILAQHTCTAAALEAFWKLASLDSVAAVEKIIVSSSLEPVTVYDHVVGRIQAWINDKHPGPGESHVLVDQARWSDLNPLANNWSGGIAMLVLTFPEIHWVFGVLSAPPVEILQNKVPKAEVDQQWHDLTGLLRPDHDPIFDLSGLRWHIRDRILEEKGRAGHKIAPYIPQRNTLCATLDDELAYAYFHAYTAYRFGYRSIPLVRDVLAQHLFGIGKTPPNDLRLTLEDVFLSYPDQQHTHYSELSEGQGNSRSHMLPGLTVNKTQWRVFVTSGQSHQNDEAKSSRNRTYIRNNAGVECAKRILKPSGGIFDLWDESGLGRRLKWTDDRGRIRRGVAENFVWPPHRQSQVPGDTGHSAPGRLALIATRLIERARKLLADDHLSVSDAVKGALWATDALELLGDRTPTSAIEAMSLKHEFEVLAECGFPGVEYHLVVKPRIREILRELGPLSVWFHRSQRETARLNAEMTILNRLVQIFRDHGEFDEEKICLNRVLHLHHSLWMHAQPWRFVFLPILRYVEFLLASFMQFCVALIGWLVGLSLVFLAAPEPAVQAANGSASQSWSIAMTAFFGAEPMTITQPLWVVVTTLAILAGVAHLGVFISHLYTLVSRK